MAEAFKHLINGHTVRHAGEHLQRAWVGFDRPRFEHLALKGLEGLEFKARALQIADALGPVCTPSPNASRPISPFDLSSLRTRLRCSTRWDVGCAIRAPHVRRLVSEGSRPRLPWGLRLQALAADPTPC